LLDLEPLTPIESVMPKQFNNNFYTNGMEKGFGSQVTIARPNSTSLRTTIPEGIDKTIGLNVGDTLNWSIEVKNGKMIVIVTNSKG